ncbi:uncharacterized protein FMAN_15428 [Fusarium mangiferae]|uniref:Uncharacterized protein n=1 Tax=Fusarium mangiferae TaxID=192010 RepID=A0A1L7UER8_FUSMA|nr:uncharacterized protein FMAN_15428 [Fusarium mangiferae]
MAACCPRSPNALNMRPLLALRI